MSDQEAANQLQSISLALQGLLVGVILVFPALLNLDIFSLHLELCFLPVAAIHYWPRQASYSWSLFAVFILGLFYDLASNSPLGMWTFSFLILFLVLGGGMPSFKGLVNATFGFAVSLAIVFIIIAVLVRFSLGQWPQMLSYTLSALITVFLFPIIYWARKIVLAVRGISEPDGYAQKLS